MKICIGCDEELPLEDFYPKRNGSADGRQPRCIECSRGVVREHARTPKARATSRAYREAHPLTTEAKLFYAARRRAKTSGTPFTITVDDIHIPEFCPALGLRLEAGNQKGPKPNAPSIDRIIPELGYIPGNVQVISHKANSMKRNASIEELAQFAEWIQKAVVHSVTC